MVRGTFKTFEGLGKLILQIGTFRLRNDWSGRLAITMALRTLRRSVYGISVDATVYCAI